MSADDTEIAALLRRWNAGDREDRERAAELHPGAAVGLSLEATANALGVSLATVKRELRSARAWLAGELRDDGPGRSV